MVVYDLSVVVRVILGVGLYRAFLPTTNGQIKPSNILIDAEETTPKVADFGISVTHHELAQVCRLRSLCRWGGWGGGVRCDVRDRSGAYLRG